MDIEEYKYRRTVIGLLFAMVLLQFLQIVLTSF